MASVIKPIRSTEFFYGSDDRPSDKNMHMPILQTGDIRMGLAKPLIDENRLKVIREKLKSKKK